MANGAQISSDQVLRAWVESEASPAAWVGPEGQYLAINEPLRSLLGLHARGDAVGRPRAELLRTHLLPRLSDGAALAQHLGNGEHGRTELRLSEAQAPHRVWRYLSQPLHGDDGELLGWRETLSEQAEGTDVQRRLAELGQQLIAVRRECEERLHNKDEFMARVSHELRTPMTAIIGFCHMLLHYSGELQPVQRDFVQKVLKNASILLQLLNNVLDLAKMESGPLSVTREPVDLATVIGEAVETVEPQTWEKQLHVEVDLQGATVVVSDRLKLKQVLINLLSNAVKYTEEGSVGLQGRPLDDGYELRVVDTGPGIPADQLERIFEAYVQIEATDRPRRATGTGLGLAICRRLASVLRGRLTVESEPGKGSCFILWLPRELPDEALPPATG